MKKIAILSDTHGFLRSEVLSHMKDVVHIFHAGDVGNESILQKLKMHAPLTAVLGNTDYSFFGLSNYEILEVAGINFYIRHIEEHVQLSFKEAGVNVVIFGHTHKAKIHTHDNVLYLNPGSAGVKRGRVPATMILLQVHANGHLEPQIIKLKA